LSLGAGDTSRLKRIEKLASKMEAMPDAEFAAQTREWQEALQQGTRTLDSMVEPAFALVREASRRTIGLFHYPEQILGGLCLVRGRIAEMATGEGKTLAITLPAYCFALTGKGVHVSTVNTYLAERDYEFVRPLFEFLGISVSLLPERAPAPDKKQAYAADIVYGVGYEFGFDYLRDQLALMRQEDRGATEKLRNVLLNRPASQSEVAQRGQAYAIVDEIDSILIDEAGSPLVISEAVPADQFRPEPYLAARDLCHSLEEDRHYVAPGAKRNIHLTAEGREFVHKQVDVPWDCLLRPWEKYVENALAAELGFQRDAQYVVDLEGKIVIVDEFTGRRHEERTWRSGLHQAMEAKERVEIRPETESAASITRQRFYGLYDTICGLTGTAEESAGEFWHFFKLGVVQIPLHRPSQRLVLPEQMFHSLEAMLQGVVQEIAARHGTGQPILVGTRTISMSEQISARLTEAQVPHRLLTAKQDEEESEIVAAAGQLGSIVIATNMAGRGTHISLSPEAEAAGGLHVMGIERNESLRVDRQLIGRAARQGQKGSAQFFISTEDYLITAYDPGLGKRLRRSTPGKGGLLPSRCQTLMDKLQQKVEKVRFHLRLQLAKRDQWTDETRNVLS